MVNTSQPKFKTKNKQHQGLQIDILTAGLREQNRNFFKRVTTSLCLPSQTSIRRIQSHIFVFHLLKQMTFMFSSVSTTPFCCTAGRDTFDGHSMKKFLFEDKTWRHSTIGKLLEKLAILPF